MIVALLGLIVVAMCVAFATFGYQVGYSHGRDERG